jgi:hypothetical protein
VNAIAFKYYNKHPSSLFYAERALVVDLHCQLRNRLPDNPPGELTDELEVLVRRAFPPVSMLDMSPRDRDALNLTE